MCSMDPCWRLFDECYDQVMKRPKGKRKREAEEELKQRRVSLIDLPTVLLSTSHHHFLSFEDRIPLWRTCKFVHGHCGHPSVCRQSCTLLWKLISISSGLPNKGFDEVSFRKANQLREGSLHIIRTKEIDEACLRKDNQLRKGLSLYTALKSIKVKNLRIELDNEAPTINIYGCINEMKYAKDLQPVSITRRQSSIGTPMEREMAFNKMSSLTSWTTDFVTSEGELNDRTHFLNCTVLSVRVGLNCRHALKT